MKEQVHFHMEEHAYKDVVSETSGACQIIEVNEEIADGISTRLPKSAPFDSPLELHTEDQKKKRAPLLPPKPGT